MSEACVPDPPLDRWRPGWRPVVVVVLISVVIGLLAAGAITPTAVALVLDLVVGAELLNRGLARLTLAR